MAGRVLYQLQFAYSFAIKGYLLITLFWKLSCFFLVLIFISATRFTSGLEIHRAGNRFELYRDALKSGKESDDELHYARA
jgi:hypothetical protein